MPIATDSRRVVRDGPTYRRDPAGYACAGVKLFADGALGSRGAALLTDYHDEPGQHGLLVRSRPRSGRNGPRRPDCSVQVATHAIGDRASRMVLDAYARMAGTGRGAGARWRIEHAQIVSLETSRASASSGVVTSMQPIHATSDGPWVESRVRKAGLPGASAWRRFIDGSANLAFGSDFPVESDDLASVLYAAITREDLNGHPPEGGCRIRCSPPSRRCAASRRMRRTRVCGIRGRPARAWPAR